MKINTAKDLYNEISKDFKTNNRTRRTEIPEICVLRLFDKCTKVEFSIGWFDTFVVSFNPKTIGVKYIKTIHSEQKTTTISKQFPLDKENLLDTILDLYVN